MTSKLFSNKINELKNNFKNRCSDIGLLKEIQAIRFMNSTIYYQFNVKCDYMSYVF